MFKIRIADLCVEIENQYSFVQRLCADYITEDAPDFRVHVTQEQILTERQQKPYPMGYCESVCLYREIVRHLPDYQAFLFHSSVVAVDGCAYAFAAKSGTGKSTHTQLWLEHFGNRAYMVNGDKPIFRWIDGTLYAFGTPWNGKEGLGSNCRCPLQGVCFLERGETNQIRKAKKKDIIDRLFHQVLMPDEPQRLTLFLQDVENMIDQIPFYVLQCNISEEAVQVAYSAMCP